MSENLEWFDDIKVFQNDTYATWIFFSLKFK